jgi:DNA-directed RNA polymerase specialized sigma24 family protein
VSVETDPRPELPGVPDRAGAPWFATTHWSVVLEAGKPGSPQFRAALEELCRTYRLSLYSYLRRDGNSPDDAQDLTQGFFLRLLRTDSLVGVSPVKGKFRTFLLASLQHFLSDERDRARAQKRGGNQTVISINGTEAEASFLQLPSGEMSPETVFDQHWALTVLDRAFCRLRQDYTKSGRANLFESLSAFLSNEAASGDYASLVGQLRMSEQAIGVAVHRLRHRYGQCVRFEIGQTVTDPEDLNEEMHYLFTLLTG